MPPTPNFGRATPLVSMLLGEAPHGSSPQRDIYAALAGRYSALVTGDRDALLMQCGGALEWAELMLAIWRSASDRLGRNLKHSESWFVTRLTTGWQEMRRLLDLRRATDIELDLWDAGTDADLGELRDRLCLHLTRYSVPEACAAMPAILCRCARSWEPGEERMLYAAVGASLYAGEAFGSWRPGDPLLDLVGVWAEVGKTALAGLPAPKPKAPIPSHVQAIVEARKPPEPVPNGPSLLVLASVVHLPGTAKDGAPGASSSTPRSEWAPMAGRPLPLIVARDLARVRRRLVREFPDAERVIDAVLQPLAGRPFVWLSPILLRGAPGSGKSRFARRLGEELGLAVTVYGCGAVADGSFVGTSRQWSIGRACVPMQAVKRAGAANVLIVFDEISRAGTRQDNGRLTDGILALTERETSKAFHDPYLECAVDLSAVSYIATANSTEDLDPALLSRFRVLDMPLPTLASMPVLARGIVAEIRAERGLDERWLPDLTPEELELVAEHWRGGSVRVLQALVECAVGGRHAGPAN